MTKNPNRNQFSKESMLYQIKILRSFQMNGKWKILFSLQSWLMKMEKLSKLNPIKEMFLITQKQQFAQLTLWMFKIILMLKS